MIPTICPPLDIGPNLTSLILQLLIVLGALVAAYRGPTIVKQLKERAIAPD